VQLTYSHVLLLALLIAVAAAAATSRLEVPSVAWLDVAYNSVQFGRHRADIKITMSSVVKKTVRRYG